MCRNFHPFHSIMKIIAQSLGNKLEQEEELAARRLLDVLRNARLKEQEQEENEARTSEYRSEFFNTTEIYDVAAYNESESGSADYEMTTRNDKKSLRNSLEKLISLYLTKLREDNIEVNIDENGSRERRELSGKIVRRRKLIPGSCKTMRRRLGTLDHGEIEQALRNFTSTEFNIRKFLNYRSVEPSTYHLFQSDPQIVFRDCLGARGRTTVRLSSRTIILMQCSGNKASSTSNTSAWTVSSEFSVALC